MQTNNKVKIELGELELNKDHSKDIGKEIDVLLSADDIQHDDHSDVVAQVMSKAFRGAQFLYTLALPSGQVVQSLVPSHHDHAIGERIGIRVELDHVVCF